MTNHINLAVGNHITILASKGPTEALTIEAVPGQAEPAPAPTNLVPVPETRIHIHAVSRSGVVYSISGIDGVDAGQRHHANVGDSITIAFPGWKAQPPITGA